jgi:hypothetical protein
MTLHRAMVLVLESHGGGWMDRDEIAGEIRERDLYRQRGGGYAPSDQLRLRARHPRYRHLFELSDDRASRIRLRRRDQTDMNAKSDDDRPQTLAEQQLRNARRDPRLGHGRKAIVADWWAAVEAAERTRRTALFAMRELARTAVDEPDAPPGSESYAQWARAEFARLEMAADTPELNGMTLVALLSALDALVEILVPSVREMAARIQYAEIARAVAAQHPELDAQLTDDMRETIMEAAVKVMVERGPKKARQPQVRGAGTRRWEDTLRYVRLHAPPSRPIPDDLDEALREAVVLRNALVHRAARVRNDDLLQAPALRTRYAAGALIRLTRLDFRTYSAAIVAYGSEIVFRLMGSLASPVDLVGWRGYAALNT